MKNILVVLSILLLLILTFLLGTRYYMNSHKKEIITKIENAINENRKGKIIFDSIDISSIKELPHIEIQFFNLALVDSLYSQHKRKTVFLQEVIADISIIDMLSNEIKIKSISAKKGQINIFEDEDLYTNLYVFGSNTGHEDNELDFKITGNEVDVIIEDIEYTQTEKIKNKRITAHINAVDFNIDIENLVIPKLNLDIFMKEMGINLDKGTFFNNVRCVGSIHPKIDTVKKTIEVPEFHLEIGEQDFDVTAFIHTKENRFKFLLSLEKANYKQTISLLSGNIKSKLARFKLLKPFKVKAEISGSFEYRSNPLVEVEYATQNNEIIYYEENLFLNDVAFNGTSRNRIYYDDRIKTEHPKNLTNNFNNFTGFYKNIPYQLTDVTLISEFSKPVHLKSNYKVEGKIKYLNDIIKSPDYNFTNGEFLIKGSFNDYIHSLSDVLKSSKIHIESRNLVVKSKLNKNKFYLPHLALEVNQNSAEIKKLLVQINADESAQLKGNIENFSTLFIEDDDNKPTVSTLNISSDYLNYNSLLQSFGAHKKQTQSKNLTDVKHSISTLLKNFNPNINFTLQRLDFSETQFKNIKLLARYQQNALKIEEISGNYKDGKAKAKLDIDLNSRKNKNSEETIYLDLFLEVNGKIEHWTEILQSENFFFKNADYNLSVNFSDEANMIEDLVEKSKIVFNVQEGSMLYMPTGLTLPFNNISLSMQNKNAYLNDFELKLPNNQTVHLNGKLENFIELFSHSNSTNNIKSSITISSKSIDFSNFVDAFKTNHKRASQPNDVKIILKDLYAKFNPSVSMQLDNLTYKKVSLEKVNANLNFKDLNTLNFNNVYFYYFNKKVALEAQFDLSDASQTNFNTNLKVDDVAIENILETFDNFGYEQLSLPTELTGIIKTNAFFKGIIDDANGVIYNKIEADIDYNIKKLRVKNFEPLIDAGNIIFRKERFQDVIFANISSSLSVKNNIISFPQTNVQSTAFDFFVEGDIDNSMGTDLWISIPLSNIKRRDLSRIPSKKTFDEANKKIYLEIKADKKGKLHNKLYLSNKKHLRSTD